MPSANSHSHSLSPTPSTNPNNAALLPQVRRNLFSTHLSRRPASSQQASQATAAETYIPPLPPTRSPSRSPGHSPTHPRSHLSSSGIIETHANGRPLLPTLPHLAARLRLSTTSDDEEDHPFDAEDEASRNNSPTRYNHTQNHTADTDASDRERIERSLVEMMSRQRQRVGGGSSSSPRALRSGVSNVGAVEPEGRTREEEELLNLVMGSLREKVVVLEEEGWMFGERVEDTQGMV